MLCSLWAVVVQMYDQTSQSDAHKPENNMWMQPERIPFIKAWKPDTGSPFSRTPFGLKARVAA